MEVVVGTYEELLLGYNILIKDEEYLIEQSFTDHSHIGCVKSVDISRHGILASGSTDESIRLFNLKKRIELGSLVHHEGSITKVHFFGKRHMFSCSEDGSIGIWKTKNWECLRTLRGHKGPVYSVSVHRSGKMALSVSKDKTLKTWNLMTGKCAYTTSIKTVADFVIWSTDGDMYAVVTERTVDFYKVETGKVDHQLKCDFRICCLIYIQNDVVLLAGEQGIVQIYNTSTKKDMLKFNTETVRVRGVSLRPCLGSTDRWLVTASSDGFLKLWRLTEEANSWKHQLLLSHDTKFRLTCIAARNVRDKTVNSREEVTDQVTAEKLKSNIDGEIDEEEPEEGTDEDVDSDEFAAVQQPEDLNSDDESSAYEESSGSEEETSLPPPKSGKRKLKQQSKTKIDLPPKKAKTSKSSAPQVKKLKSKGKQTSQSKKQLQKRKLKHK